MSLLNFNPELRTEITTPRSKRALAALGLTTQDLYYLTREEVLQQGVQFEDVDYYVNAKIQHNRERVDRFIELAKLEHSNYQPQERESTLSHQQLSNSMQQKQEQIIRNLQNKQKIEIEREIQTEMRNQDIIAKNQYKEQRIAELRQMREEEFQKRMEEKEAKLILRDQKLKQAKLQADLQNEQIMRRFQEEELKIQQKQAKFALLKQQLKEERDEEFQNKLQRRTQRILEQQQQLQQENQIRQQEYARKLQNMEQHLQDKQQFMRQQNHLKEIKAREKYQNATAIKQLELSQMEQRMHSKEKDILMRTSMQELSRQQLLQQKRFQEQQKQYQMEQKKQYLSLEQKRRNEEYFNQEKEREQRKLKIEEDKRMKRDESSLMLQSHLEEVQMKQKYMEKQTELENQRFMAIKQQQFMNAEELRQRNILNMKRKYVQELLKLEDASQNYQIQKRKEQYKNIILLEKFDETDKRLKQQQLEYNKLQESKKQIEQQIQNEKQRILALEEFDKKKKQMVEERNNNQSTLKPTTTERVSFTNKPIKTKSATSFHLPATSIKQDQEIINNNTQNNRSSNKSKRTIDDKSISTTSQKKKRQYFISEETMKAVQLYANGETLKQFQIEIRPSRKKK